jgi:hypothetical protein
LIPHNCILNAKDLEEIETVTFCISIPYYFTGNNLYKAQTRQGHTWIRKDDRAVALQKHIEAEIFHLKIKAPKDTYCYACHVAFCSSKSSWVIDNGSKLRTIDLTNLWKVVEDGIFEGSKASILKGLDINDAFGVYLSQSKCILPEEIESPPHYLAVFLIYYRLHRAS